MINATKSEQFAHLLGGAQQGLTAYAPIKQKAHTRVITDAEKADAIIRAGEKARGAGNPRYSSERVADLVKRAKHDSSAGQAAAILQAATKARNESL